MTNKDNCLIELNEKNLIGKGQQGSVYLVKNKVVKKIDVGIHANINYYDFQPLTYRVMYEIHALKKLHDSNITPRFYQYWSCPNSHSFPYVDKLSFNSPDIHVFSSKGYKSLYIQMEYIKHSMTLGDYIKKYPLKLTDENFITILNHIYKMNKEYNIISTDCHDDNILVTRNNHNKIIKIYLIDLGLAWRSHEDKSIDKATDIFALWSTLEDEISADILLFKGTKKEQKQKLANICEEFIKNNYNGYKTLTLNELTKIRDTNIYVEQLKKIGKIGLDLAVRIGEGVVVAEAVKRIRRKINE
jgi:serine/threonine protein kinase